MNQAALIVLRGAASVCLFVFAAVGCHLIAPFDVSGLEATQDKYHCEAEVIDQFGVRFEVNNYDATGHEDVFGAQCFVPWEELNVESFDDEENAMADAWRRWLDDAIEADGWCIVEDTVSCAEAGPLGAETCPAVTLPTAARDFCAEDAIPCCIRSAPTEIDFEVLQEAAGGNNWTPVGLASAIEPSGTLQNHCDREVSFRPHDGLVGDNPGDFELFNNTCTVPEPQADHPDGLTLSPRGTPGNYCTYQLRFTPTARGARWARMQFVQADTSACANADMAHFRGRGRAGVLSGLPDEICLGRLLDGDCTQFSFELANGGPGIVAVATIDATGSFELLSSESLELAPGETTTVTVRWCSGLGGDVDDDGTLRIFSNASEEEVLVRLSRRTAGCP